MASFARDGGDEAPPVGSPVGTAGKSIYSRALGVFPRKAGGNRPPPTQTTPGDQWRSAYVAVGRNREIVCESLDPLRSGEQAVALGRKMVARADAPGWDDVSKEPYRAIKLPIHDVGGCTAFTVVFGSGFPDDRAQAFCEKLALMLLPLLRAETDPDDPNYGKTGVDRGGGDDGIGGGAGGRGGGGYGITVSRDDEKCRTGVPRALVPSLQSVVDRELETANSRARIVKVENQINEVRALMERNVEAILDRQEQLDELNNKSDALQSAANTFKKGARKLKRWHLMNQVKWGVAIGTVVTASVAVPIAILATA